MIEFGVKSLPSVAPERRRLSGSRAEYITSESGLRKGGLRNPATALCESMSASLMPSPPLRAPKRYHLTARHINRIPRAALLSSAWVTWGSRKAPFYLTAGNASFGSDVGNTKPEVTGRFPEGLTHDLFRRQMPVIRIDHRCSFRSSETQSITWRADCFTSYGVLAWYPVAMA